MTFAPEPENEDGELVDPESGPETPDEQPQPPVEPEPVEPEPVEPDDETPAS